MNFLLYPPLAGVHHDELLRLVAADGIGEFFGERLFATAVKLAIVDRITLGSAGVAVVPHRRKEQRNPSFVGPDVGRLAGDLGHPQQVLVLVEIVKKRGVGVELVAEYNCEIADFLSLAHRCDLLQPTSAVFRLEFGRKLPLLEHRHGVFGNSLGDDGPVDHR